MATKTEQAPIYCLRRGEALIGEMQTDRQRIADLPNGERIKLQFSTGRVPSRLRFYWAFLRDVVDATECAPNAETLHELVKLETGFTTPVKVRGYTVLVPRSVSFASMSEEEFMQFLAGAERFIAATYGIVPKDTKGAAA
ncbi:MAG: hypothetical protein AAAB13_20765 [Pseudomonas sp.]|jgi:hypothetical protein